MKLIVTSCLCVLCGCVAPLRTTSTPTPTSPVNPFTTFAATNVAKIFFASDSVVQPAPGVYPLRAIGVETTKPDLIAQLYNSVATAKFAEEYSAEMAFAGIVSYQVFLDVHSNVLAVTHLVVHPSTMVVVAEGRMIYGTVYLGRSDSEEEFYMCGYSPLFSKLVKEMMKKKQTQIGEPPAGGDGIPPPQP